MRPFTTLKNGPMRVIKDRFGIRFSKQQPKSFVPFSR